MRTKSILVFKERAAAYLGSTNRDTRSLLQRIYDLEESYPLVHRKRLR
jgi:hypothetical protein